MGFNDAREATSSIPSARENRALLANMIGRLVWAAGTTGESWVTGEHTIVAIHDINPYLLDWMRRLGFHAITVEEARRRLDRADMLPPRPTIEEPTGATLPRD